MKRKLTVVFFIIGLFVFSSCDELKKAYEETFRGSEGVQNELASIFEGSADKHLENEDEVAKKVILQTYNHLIDMQFPELNELQKEKALEVIGRDYDKWRRAEISLYFQLQMLDVIQRQLYDFMNSGDVMLYSKAIFVEDNRVRVPVVNPRNEQEVDWYYYETKTGIWKKTDPIKLSQRDLERMDKSVFPLSSIKLSATTVILSEIMKKLPEIEGAEIPSSFVYYPYNESWTTTVKGSRADYSVKADKDGNITKFERK